MAFRAKDPVTTDISVLELGTFSKSSGKPNQAKTENETQKKKQSLKAPDDSKKMSDSISKNESSNENSSINNNSLAKSGGANTQAPRVIKEAFAQYPKSAKNAGIEGVVEMQLVIDETGKVESAEILRGPGYGLNEAALGVIKDFIFSPAKQNGETVSAKIIYRYRFVLGGR